MPEFFLDFWSEEIPARMQASVSESIRFSLEEALVRLGRPAVQMFFGPRHQAFVANVAAKTESEFVEVRGPKQDAAAAALDGFARKQNIAKDGLVLENGYWWLRQNTPPIEARQLLKSAIESLMTSSFWPKTMRWGQGGCFTWVRPLRRIVCIFDGDVIPLVIGGVTAGRETEGHRGLAPGKFSVSSVTQWKDDLKRRHVVADQSERRALVADGIRDAAKPLGLNVVEDAGLVDEVTGLVEWPVPLIGKIDEQFMGLPQEVRELSMKVNQRYFALRDAEGKPAPYFAFVANLEAPDGGAAIVAGNERVLRARLSDARHFWSLDLKTPLDALLPKLEKITFHAKIGSQAERVKRIAALSRKIAGMLGADEDQAEWAGKLCKADLVTGMVGEFPELQGIMGGYYAAKNPRGWDGAVVGPAIATHYQPKGPSDAVPSGQVAVSVALADKLDTLIEFFRVDEKPTGSGDPYALRRAALGVIRIILENDLRLKLKPLLGGDGALFDFIVERLRVKLRGEGKRFDVLDAVLAAGADDDLVRVMRRVEALGDMLSMEDGKNLLAAYKRAANILKIENAKDGPHGSDPVNQPLPLQEEQDFRDMLGFVQQETIEDFKTENFARAVAAFAKLRSVVDAFFENVIVNASEPELRLNRLKLLARFRDTVNQIADFSKIEG
jgi:glycyl-tRNA synthetase beta chain